MRRSRGFFAVMEDDAPIVEVNVDDGVPGEVERDVAEVSDAADEVQGDVEALEDAIDSAEDIEAIADAAEQSVEEGEGLDPVAAEIAEVAVESIYRRLGVPSHVRAMPSMESFGSKTSRKTATRVAVEGMMDKVKEIWKKVVEFFKNIYNKVVSFVTGLFATSESLIKTLKALETKVKDLKGVPEEDTVEDKRIPEAFGESEGSSMFEKAKKTLDAQETCMVGSLSLTNSISTAIKDVKSAIEKTTTADFAVKQPDADKEKMFSIVSAHFKNAFKAKDEGKNLVAGPYVYGYTLTLSENAKEEELELEIDKGKNSRSEKIAVLSRTEMEELRKLAYALALDVTSSKGMFEVMKHSSEHISGIASKAIEAMDKIEKNKEGEAKENDKATREAISVLRKYLVQLGNINLKVATFAPAKSVQACKEAVAYIALSMSQYKESK